MAHLDQHQYLVIHLRLHLSGSAWKKETVRGAKVLHEPLNRLTCLESNSCLLFFRRMVGDGIILDGEGDEEDEPKEVYGAVRKNPNPTAVQFDEFGLIHRILQGSKDG